MIARVVPDIPSFSVDDGFRYSIPADLEVDVGAVVRVPLGGRTVRGFVVGLESGDGENLKAIRARSGKTAVFNERLLQSLRWAAHHYVAPLSVLLRRAAPPNIPAPTTGPAPAVDRREAAQTPAGALGRSIAEGRTRNCHLQTTNPGDLADLVGPILGAGMSVMLVAPTGLEAVRIHERLAATFGEAVLAITPDTSDREATAVWAKCRSAAGYLLVGTPRVSLWPVAQLGAAVVMGEARRGMKDRQTPTVHSRELLRARSVVERFALVTTGLVPSTETIAAGTEVIVAGPGRPWSLIEFVDRSVDPPGTGPLSDRTKTAIAAAAKRAENVFVFTHRRGYAPAFRCVRCRELRTCGGCGARTGREDTCRRCEREQGSCRSCGADRFEPLGAGVDRIVELVKRFVDADKVGLAGEGRLVTVGSVRDVPAIRRCSLAVVVDADGLVLGTDYRAGEDALQSLARVAAVVGSGHGRRTIVQTSNPAHPVLEALRRGEVLPFLAAELEQRAAFGFPPVGDLIVLECRGCPDGAAQRLTERFPEVTVLGPAPVEGGLRWLLQGSDLSAARKELRKLAAEWRDAGASLRIDVDPIDL